MLASLLFAFATSAAAVPFAPDSLYLPAELRLEFGSAHFTGLQARQLDNETISSENGTSSSTPLLSSTITPAPSASASASASSNSSFFVSTYEGETYTYGPPEPEVSVADIMRCSVCTIRVDDICKSQSECAQKVDKLEKRLCESMDKAVECYKCSHNRQDLSESAQMNITANEKYCAKRFGGALSTLSVSGGAVAMAVVALSVFL